MNDKERNAIKRNDLMKLFKTLFRVAKLAPKNVIELLTQRGLVDNVTRSVLVFRTDRDFAQLKLGEANEVNNDIDPPIYLYTTPLGRQATYSAVPIE